MDSFFITVILQRLNRKLTSECLITLKRARVTVRRKRIRAKRSSYHFHLTEGVEKLSKKSAEMSTKLEYFFLQNKKLVDDNRHLLSNVLKFKEEDSRRMAETLTQLFISSLSTEEEKYESQARRLSQHTCQTDISEKSIETDLLKNNTDIKLAGCDSFRRLPIVIPSFKLEVSAFEGDISKRKNA